jgi:lipoate-protein ligase A
VKYLDRTWPSPAENLACDEALLDWCEEEGGTEVLRLWEAREHFVVLGYANHATRAVDLDACRTRAIPVLRRCSGGGTVLQGPGCLNYSLILKIEGKKPLQSISETNCYIMKRNAEAVAAVLGKSVAIEGFTDLAVNNLKFSGNAQRRKRGFLLFHGTFLLDYDSALMEELLLLPSRQPDYRQNRSHAGFLTRLNLPMHSIKAALKKSWAATDPLQEIPNSIIARLVQVKYSQKEWNLKWE